MHVTLDTLQGTLPQVRLQHNSFMTYVQALLKLMHTIVLAMQSGSTDRLHADAHLMNWQAIPEASR